MAKKLQIIIAILIFGIGIYYKNHWVLGSLTLVILVFSIFGKNLDLIQKEILK